MACRRKPYQKSVDRMRKLHNHSRQRQRCLSFGIPLLELFERLSGELGVGFYPVALNEGRKNSQPCRLEKPKFRNNKSLQFLNWLRSGLPASDARPCTPREWDKSVFIPFTHEPLWFESKWVVPIPCCVALCKLLEWAR